MERKMFTVSQANLALPRVSRLVSGLQERHRWVRAHPQQVPLLEKTHQIVNEGPVNSEYFETLIGIRKSLRELDEIGVQVKDISTGLVDFPARMYGREVLLCWKLGEDNIGFWHDLEGGYEGRQPLPDGGGEPETGKQGH